MIIENIGKQAIYLISSIGKIILFIFLFFKFLFPPKFYFRVT